MQLFFDCTNQKEEDWKQLAQIIMSMKMQLEIVIWYPPVQGTWFHWYIPVSTAHFWIVFKTFKTTLALVSALFDSAYRTVLNSTLFFLFEV